jgi:hypothetical protein
MMSDARIGRRARLGAEEAIQKSVDRVVDNVMTQGFCAPNFQLTGARPMTTDSLAASDALSADGATAPRVSVQSMEDKIVSRYFVNAGDAVSAVTHVNQSDLYEDSPLHLMTLCLLVMRNGFVVVGKSAPASAANFDREKGETFAYEDAIRQLWPLEGYALREQLGAS